MSSIPATLPQQTSGNSRGTFHAFCLSPFFQKYGSLSITIIVNFLLLGSFYDQSWAPTDDGNYAHIAERFLAGEVLNKDVQDVHAGYINFVNAASMWMFGPTLVSLRYPLILISLLQAILIHLLFKGKGQWLSILASISLTTLGILQFFNPTANWYCQFLFVTLICLFQWISPSNRIRLIILGFVVGTIFLFRQLTGGIVGGGLLAFLLIESRPKDDAQNVGLFFSKSLLIFMAIGLTFYFFQHTSFFIFLLFGFFPLAFLIWSFFNTKCTNNQAFHIVGHLSIGALLSSFPILLYHFIHQSVSSWLHDIIIRAFTLGQLPFIFTQDYAEILAGGIQVLVNPITSSSPFNGLFFIILPFLSFLNGALIFHTLLRRAHEKNTISLLHPLPVLGMFFAITSLHYQIPIYLFYSVGISLLGIMYQLRELPLRKNYFLLLAIFLVSVALVFHAGQPHSRNYLMTLHGAKLQLVKGMALEKSGLRIRQSDLSLYSHLVQFIQEHSASGEAIFVFPNNAELYFLANRPNPFRFFNLALDVTTVEETNRIIRQLENSPPKLVIYNPHDKYNSSNSVLLAYYIQSAYQPIKTIGNFEFFSLIEE